MIQYAEFSPAPSLNPFIECIWTLAAQRNFFKRRELIIPGGRIEMIFNFSYPICWLDSKCLASSHPHFGSFLLGPRNRHFFIEQKGSIDMLGVRFRHGGFAPFTSIPMSLLMNEIVPQEEIFGQDASPLFERLLETVDSNLKVRIVEDFLIRRFHYEPSNSQTLQLISLVKENKSLSSRQSLSEHTGVHYKKLERVFLKNTGYTPKNFSRVIRFYTALQEIKKSSNSLTGIGLNNGYYDQPHFIRDFKAFTGKSPTQFHTDNPTIANLLLQSRHV